MIGWWLCLLQVKSSFCSACTEALAVPGQAGSRAGNLHPEHLHQEEGAERGIRLAEYAWNVWRRAVHWSSAALTFRLNSLLFVSLHG